MALVGIVIAAHVAPAAPVPTVAAIRDSIDREGAKATIADLAKAGQWDAVADRMGSGDTAWIGLAPAFAAGSDAGSSEDLGISLAFSLPRNPRAVLSVLDPADGPAIGASRVCGAPFVDDTVTDLPAYHATQSGRSMRSATTGLHGPKPNVSRP